MIEINNKSPIPIYIQIRDGIVREIGLGRLKEGDFLPSVRQLAIDIGVNHMTVNKAYNLLKDQGFIRIDKRVGASVSIDRSDQALKSYRKELGQILLEYKARGFNEDEIIDLLRRMEEYVSDESN